jgi:hypothetical protein
MTGERSQGYYNFCMTAFVIGLLKEKALRAFKKYIFRPLCLEVLNYFEISKAFALFHYPSVPW